MNDLTMGSRFAGSSAATGFALADEYPVEPT
jgi:hypothetical protein